MKNQNFLKKANKEGKLELVEPSEEICQSYLEKANDCLKSAKILFESNLYENSIGMSYYAMYNSLLAILHKAGIKSEIHDASIIILNEILGKEELSKLISRAKKERIDKQYYISQNSNENKESSRELIESAESFILEIKTEIEKLDQEEVESLRTKLNKIIQK